MPGDKAQENFTDPDSRIMKRAGGGFDPGYRSEEDLRHAPIELVVALGREGMAHAQVDAQLCPHTAATATRLRTDEGKQAFRRRSRVAEPPNGWIKHVLGFRQSGMRGLHRVRAEWKSVCAAPKQRRMAAMSAA